MDSDQPSYSVGAAQVAECFLDRAGTVEKDCEFILEAGERELDLLVFPEFHIPAAPRWHEYTDITFEQYYKRLFEESVTVPSHATERLCDAANEAGTAVVVGVNEKLPKTSGTLYNSLVFIDQDGTLLGVRRKLVPTLSERLFHTGGTGNDVRTFDSSLGVLGGLMCGEHTNPLLIYSLLAQGQELHAAAWPAFPEFDQTVRETRIGVRTRYQAFVGGLPTVSATGVVTEELADAIGRPDLSTDSGTSAIIAPSGEYIAGPMYEGEGIVEAEIDMGETIKSRAIHDVTGHYNRFDIFTLTVNRDSQAPINFREQTETEQDGHGETLTEPVD